MYKHEKALTSGAVDLWLQKIIAFMGTMIADSGSKSSQYVGNILQRP
jgi:hypothetical protein